MKKLAQTATKQFLIGFFLCTCVVLLKTSLGIVFSKFYFFTFQNLDWRLIAIAIFEPLLTALFEEIVARGLIFGSLLWLLARIGHQSLEKFGILIAIILQALVFVYFHHHHLNINASNVSHFAFGITLAFFTLWTRALWMAVGFHFSWNFFQKLSYGVSVDYMPKLSGLVTIEANLMLISTYLTCSLALAMITLFFIVSAKSKDGFQLGSK